MIKSSGNRLERTEQETVLTAIRCVSVLCRLAQPDAAVEHEIRELEALMSAVEGRWPLPPSVKQQIDLGPFAAKNIADWDPALADVLMHLDYALQHDGASLKQVLLDVAAMDRKFRARLGNGQLDASTGACAAIGGTLVHDAVSAHPADLKSSSGQG